MYKALYRKYRPLLFDDVVGQVSIVKTLKNSVNNNRFGHAYLFYGPRGVGKTTLAKIFARSVNCLNPIDGECCQKCENCVNAFDRECVDIIEIDAASNNGVDEIRELINKSMLVPNSLKYKIYIVDEVHMLSMGAFNALLKTLEEPPEHVMFILATTELRKVPETIVSRCQCFAFERISVDDIVRKLKSVCEKEKVSAPDNVLTEIAIYSEGGMRDSLSMLDKLIAFNNSEISVDDFYDLNGMIGENDLREFGNLIFSGKVTDVLLKIKSFVACGKNIISITSQLMYYLHSLIVGYYFSGNNNFEVDIKEVTHFVELLNEKMFDIRKADNPRLYLEILLLDFINKNISREIISTETEVASVTSEQKNDVDVSVANTTNSSDHQKKFEKVDAFTSNILNISEIMEARINNILSLASKKALNDEKKKFLQFNDYVFDEGEGYLACAFLDGVVCAASDDGVIVGYEYPSNVAKNLSVIDKLTTFYNKVFSANKKIAILSLDEWNNRKNQYIDDMKKGIKYTVIEEPKEILEEKKNSDILTSETIGLFNDIVEIEK